MRIYITNIERSYNEVEHEQTLTLYGRTDDGTAETIEVFGFEDYFYVDSDELREGPPDNARSLDDVASVEVDGYETLEGDEVGKVTLDGYYSKSDVADDFDNTYDSQVFVTNRLRIDLGIYTGVEAPSNQCHYTELEPCDEVTQPRTLTFDIETDDRGEFPEHGEKRILTISAHDSFTDEYHGFIDTDGVPISRVFPDGKPEGFDVLHYEETERELLSAFSDWWTERNFDVITGWNIEDFDCPYLLTRMDDMGMDIDQLSRSGYAKIKNGQEARISGHSIHDMLEAYKMTKQNELRSYKLDAVADEELGDHKLDHTGESIWQMYEQDCDKLMRYNLKDVALVVQIEQEVGVLAFKEKLRNQVGVDLDGTTANNSFIEMMTRRKLFEKGLVGGDSDYYGGKDDYEGGFVFPAYNGVAENVVGVDLASLYPYTMAMFNASPETQVDAPITLDDIDPGGENTATVNGKEVPVAVAPGGTVFRRDEDGLFKELVDDAISLKSEYKTLRNNAEPGTEEYDDYDETYNVSKTITNSVYGVLGWEKFFLYDRAVAESVTLAGQAAIKETCRYINEETPAEVIYGDTDSNYLRLPSEWSKERCLEKAQEIVEELNERVYPELAAEHGVPEEDCLWDIEVEAYMERFFQAGQKKFYAYLCTWKDGKDCDPKTAIKGFGSQRSDSSMLTKNLQETVLKNILHGADHDEIGQLVHEAANELSKDNPDWERIGIPGGLSKDLENYAWTDGTPQGAHPRAAYICNVLNQTDLGAGSKPKRVYLKEKVPPEERWDGGQIDVIGFDHPEHVPDWARVDTQRMIETLIKKPMDKILAAIGMDVDAAVKNQTQTGFGAFA